MYRRRSMSAWTYFRYPELARCGEISPSDSKNLIFDIVTSGNSSWSCFSTAPMPIVFLGLGATPDGGVTFATEFERVLMNEDSDSIDEWESHNQLLPFPTRFYIIIVLGFQKEWGASTKLNVELSSQSSSAGSQPLAGGTC